MMDRKEVLKTLLIVALVVVLIIVCSAVIQWQKHPEKSYMGVTAKSIEEHYGEIGDPGWIPEDLNKDGRVDYLDVSLFSSHAGD